MGSRRKDWHRHLNRRIARLKATAKKAGDLSKYRPDPVGYCREVLGVTLTPMQEAIARAAAEPPYRVLVPAGHIVGKSFLGACLACWWYDTRPDSVCLTTAPTYRQVVDILWKEIRRVRRKARRGPLGGFVGPKMPRLESSETHFAHGYTAGDATAFQGQHEAAVMILFDEAEGVGPEFWEAAETMLNGDAYCFVAFYNPTQQSGPTVDEERAGRARLIRLSSVEHPNIAAELAGRPPPYPSAIRLGRLRELLDKWGERIARRDAGPLDVVLGEQAWRPGPVAEARLLGRRPSKAFDAVFSDALCDWMEKQKLPDTGPLQVGVDVARFGDDDTAWHIRKGGVSLRHERANNNSVVEVFERTKVLLEQVGRQYGVDPKAILVAVDDCGVGGGVTDLLGHNGWRVVGVNAAWKAPQESEYPNLRSALWFGLAEAAMKGFVATGGLPQHVLGDLRRELTAPVYTLDTRGRRCVEPKEATKARIGKSPDNADAMLLAYANVAGFSERVAGRVYVP